LKGLPTSDAGIVVYGSLARKEWTKKSDLDWTLLVDGQADPQHLEIAHEIAHRLEDGGFKRPGRTGTFGSMTFSHDLVHKIGGEEDTNANTTRRVLLLLESTTIGKPDSYRRMLLQILTHYLDEDRGFKYGSLPHKVPRVLLNDIVRYWRTVAVDFVHKQRDREGHGWCLRNAKLRMSRKLIFAAGLLSCFSCEMFSPSAARHELVGKNHLTTGMVRHLMGFMAHAPLEVLATVLLRLNIGRGTVLDLLSSYDQFLGLLNNPRKRKHLENLRPENIGDDKVFEEVRGISHRFQDGLTALFFRDNRKLRELITFYGVF
jgi:Nucleotidyltransferase domain